MPKVNFTDVSDSVDAIPAGTYIVNITDGEMKEAGPRSKNPGSEYIKWELTVAEGEYQGRKVFTNTSMLPQALFALKGMLKAVGGYDVDGELDFEIEDVIGKQMAVTVSQYEYPEGSGDMQNNVKKFKATSAASSGDESLLPK